MATRAGIDTAIVGRLTDDHQVMSVAIKAEFDTDDIRIWSGLDDLTISSETYTGAGTLLGISGNEDTAELTSTGTVVTLSGMDDTVLGYALSENYQNRPITILSSDTSFRYVQQLQDMDIVWGKQSQKDSIPNTTGGKGGGKGIEKDNHIT